ncbi:MAG: MipA/OmpV family protein [Candidatus Thiodiazotropha sp.]
MSCLLFGFSTHSFAENSDNATWQVQVGPVASVNTSFYQGVGEEYYLLPLVIAEYKRFYLQGIDAGYRFYQREDGQQLAVEIGRTFDGYESNDARFLSGMATRKAAWETRLVYEAIVGGGQLKGKLMQDISHSHEGFSAHLEYERPLWNDETHLVTWLAGGEYWDSKKTDYYFGVDASEARSNRVAYSASDSHNLFVGGNAIKQLTPKFSVMLNAEYRIASDAVKNSPLVSRNDQWSAYGGIFYEF